MFGRAIEELQRARRSRALPYVEGYIGYAYAAIGERNAALKIIKQLNDRALHQYVSPCSTAMIYLALGDKQRALANLEKAYEVRSLFLFTLKADKIYDPLRSEPRFLTLLKKIGFNQ